MKLSLLVQAWRTEADEYEAAFNALTESERRGTAYAIIGKAAMARRKANELEAALAQQVQPDDYDAPEGLLLKPLPDPQQAQPRCEHGKTYAHTYNQAQPGDFDASVWCPGPVAAPQPEPRKLMTAAEASEYTRSIQPEPEDALIAKWRAWWLGMADEAAKAGTESGDYNARLYRDIIEDFDRTTQRTRI